jgi:hypothetical protein
MTQLEYAAKRLGTTSLIVRLRRKSGCGRIPIQTLVVALLKWVDFLHFGHSAGKHLEKS